MLLDILCGFQGMDDFGEVSSPRCLRCFREPCRTCALGGHGGIHGPRGERFAAQIDLLGRNPGFFCTVTENFLFQDFFPVVLRAFRMALGDMENVRPEYRLIKLHAETVNDLNRLKAETAQASLNDLVVKMIPLTDSFGDCLGNRMGKLS